MHLRQRDPRAAGLVIAIDQEHARGIAQILHERLRGLAHRGHLRRSRRPRPKISAFAEGNAPWIVAVRMVSEGVDIPRLRVGVYATNTVTELFFRQAVGRLVRWRGALGSQTAYMFIPDDTAPAHVRRRHRRAAPPQPAQARAGRAAVPRTMERVDDPPPGEAPDEPELDDGQLSLFSAISAVPLDEHGRPLDGRTTRPSRPTVRTRISVGASDASRRPAVEASMAPERRAVRAGVPPAAPPAAPVPADRRDRAAAEERAGPPARAARSRTARWCASWPTTLRRPTPR